MPARGADARAAAPRRCLADRDTSVVDGWMDGWDILII